jgi:diacylglycerol kinase family enzyme
MLATIIANTSRYGGVAPVAGRARVDDGLLDIVTFEDDEGSSASHRLGLALEATRGDLDARAVVGVTYERGTRVVLTPERALPVQADGDVIAMCERDTPLIVEVEPAAVTMLVGPRPNPLWGVPG